MDKAQHRYEVIDQIKNTIAAGTAAAARRWTAAGTRRPHPAGFHRSQRPSVDRDNTQ